MDTRLCWSRVREFITNIQNSLISNISSQNGHFFIPTSISALYLTATIPPQNITEKSSSRSWSTRKVSDCCRSCITFHWKILLQRKKIPAHKPDYQMTTFLWSGHRVYI